MRNSDVSIFLIGVFALSGCGGGESVSISGTASIFNGATPTARNSAERLKEVSRRSSRPSSGNWLLSPDKMKLTLKQIQLTHEGTSGSGSNSDVSNCIFEYDRSKAGLAKIIDCPFSVSEGTYKGLGINFDATYEVLINDTTNNIYTDPNSPTKFSATAPAGGGQFVSLTTGSSGSTFGNQSALPSPLTISAGSSVSLSIVVNGLQFLRANVSESTIGVGWPNSATYNNDPFRPDMTGSVTSIAKLGFYVRSEIGNALSYNTNTINITGISSVAIYYSTATTPASLFMNLNGAPSCGNNFGLSGAINSPPTESGLGGYLGRDPTGALGWAIPTDNTWKTYSAWFNMSEKSTLGDTTTLKCDGISTDPNPPGGTFSTEAPNITSPDYSVNLKLVAK